MAVAGYEQVRGEGERKETSTSERSHYDGRSIGTLGANQSVLPTSFKLVDHTVTVRNNVWWTLTKQRDKMNSYPPELLAQLAPVMFVAGLDAPPNPPDPAQGAPSKLQDPFAVLKHRLREALVSQRKVAIWQPEKMKIFQAVLVDAVRAYPVLPIMCLSVHTQDARFPPRKLPPTEDQQFHPLHSPLSPLTPSSPLYPDGLIAPIWIRKHTTLVPSVFVVFKRIYEHPSSPANISGAEHADYEKEREAEERKRDTELSAEIALRKKSTNERSIKLTAVLMASRKMLGSCFR